MLRVTIMDITETPVDLISVCAGNCYGKDNSSFKRVKRCRDARHDSVFEHAKVTFKLEGVSRNLTHQLVRHRLCSFNEMSLRYVKLDGTQEYVVPPSILANPDVLEAYMNVLETANDFYAFAIDEGIPAEDARYALPGSIETSIVATCNVRELKHICDLRIDKHAQWEIRDAMTEVLYEIVDCLNEAHDWNFCECSTIEQWMWLIEEYIMEGKEL